MKVYLSAEHKELERLGTATVFRTPSKSRQGMFHYVTVFTNGQGVKCSCEGFSFNKKCWHIDAVPLCMAKDPTDFEPGRMVTPRTCSFVDQHEGDHSWTTST